MSIASVVRNVLKYTGYLGNQVSTFTTNTFSPAADDMVYVVVTATSSYNTLFTAASITDSLGTHLSWSKLEEVGSSSGQGTATGTWVFYARCPSAQTNMTATVTLTQATGQYVFVADTQVFSFSGADSVIGTVVKGETTTQNPTIAFTPTAAGSAVLIALAKFHASSATAPTAGTGMKAIGTSTGGNSTLGYATFWYSGSTTAPVLTPDTSALSLNANSSQTATYWQYIAFEVKAAGGASGPTFKLWNGTAEVPVTLSVWNGTAELPVTKLEIAP